MCGVTSPSFFDIDIDSSSSSANDMIEMTCTALSKSDLRFGGNLESTYVILCWSQYNKRREQTRHFVCGPLPETNCYFREQTDYSPKFKLNYFVCLYMIVGVDWFAK